MVKISEKTNLVDAYFHIGKEYLFFFQWWKCALVCKVRNQFHRIQIYPSDFKMRDSEHIEVTRV